MTEEEVMKALEMVSQKNYNSEYEATQDVYKRQDWSCSTGSVVRTAGRQDKDRYQNQSVS